MRLSIFQSASEPQMQARRKREKHVQMFCRVRFSFRSIHGNAESTTVYGNLLLLVRTKLTVFQRDTSRNHENMNIDVLNTF